MSRAVHTLNFYYLSEYFTAFCLVSSAFHTQDSCNIVILYLSCCYWRKAASSREQYVLLDNQ